MVNYVYGDLWNSECHVLVNTVNCVGVMGKGLALGFRERFPEMYEEYRLLCGFGKIRPGRLWVWKSPVVWVVNFPTKDHWRDRSQLDWIESGLQQLSKCPEGPVGMTFPGCGNGGLSKADVRPLIDKYLGPSPVEFRVYEY